MNILMCDGAETESIDKLYLELSQFTKAKTKKEIELGEAIELAHRKLYNHSKNNRPINDDVFDALVLLRDAMTYVVNP